MFEVFDEKDIALTREYRPFLIERNSLQEEGTPFTKEITGTLSFTLKKGFIKLLQRRKTANPAIPLLTAIQKLILRTYFRIKYFSDNFCRRSFIGYALRQTLEFLSGRPRRECHHQPIGWMFFRSRRLTQPPMCIALGKYPVTAKWKMKIQEVQRQQCRQNRNSPPVRKSEARFPFHRERFSAQPDGVYSTSS